MKIRLVVALAGLAITFTAPVFAQQKDTADPQLAEEVRALAAKYDEVFNINDAAAIATLYTEDGVHGFHGTIRGREAIEKWYAHEFQSWHPNKRFTAVGRVNEIGNEVRSTGRWSATYNDWGTLTNHGGYYSWTIVREGETWKIRKESISESNPWSVN
jgi:uncharacterized protein (TIGR02246 family)